MSPSPGPVTDLTIVNPVVWLLGYFLPCLFYFLVSIILSFQ
jgi:hypothetical protein